MVVAAVLVAGCGSLATVPASRRAGGPLAEEARRAPSPLANEVVLFALGLIETGYRFGGKNPEAGFDCSGMVAYVFGNAAGIRLSGSAADIARKGRPVPHGDMQPGDLVFFNTLGRSHSHVGIYLGDGRFVHAPSSRGEARVRTDSLTDGYFAGRFEEARTYFE